MNTDSIRQAAAAKLDADRNERINAVTELAESARTLSQARQELASAEQQHAQLYRASLRLGWTESDIKGFGIDAPAKSAGGRPRKLKTGAPKATPGAAPEHSTTEGQ